MRIVLGIGLAQLMLLSACSGSLSDDSHSDRDEELKRSCDDGNPCTADARTRGGCTYQPISDGSACPGGSCSAGACVTIAAADMASPPPDNLSPTAQRLVNGHQMADFSGVPSTLYIIKGSPDLVTWTVLATMMSDSSGAFSFEDTDTALHMQGGSYFYRSVLPASPPVPAPPASVTAAAVSSSQISLSWVDNSVNESAMHLEQALSAHGPFSEVATLGVNTITIARTGLASSTHYYFRLRTSNANGPSIYSQIADASTPIGLGPPPGAWAKGFGGTSYNYGQAVAVEPATGNVVLTGTFAGTTDFGGTTDSGGGPLTSAGGLDMILAKYAPTGAYLWSLRFGNLGGEYPKAIALDLNGNIFVAGSFTSTGDVGGGPIASFGGQDAFVAKYSPTGQFQWMKRFGNVSDDVPNSMVIDSSGNVVLTGFFTGLSGVSFGGATFSSSSGNAQMYVAKLSGADGSHLWSQAFQANSSQGNGVAVNASGDVFVASTVNGRIDFGDGLVLTVAGFPYNSFETVLMKLSGANGSRIWAKLVGINSYDEKVCGVAVDSGGNPVFAGNFTAPTMDFGNGQVANNLNGNNTVFLAKLSGVDGSARWVRSSSNNNITAGATPSAVTIDRDDNIALTGFFPSNVTLGSTTLTSLGNQNVFVAKYSGLGSFIWAKQFGGSSLSNSVGSNSIAADSGGSLLVTGHFMGTIDFSGTTLRHHSSYDAFITRMNP